MDQIERVIYVGPSLFGVNVEKLPGELWLGPAKQGDILKAVLQMNPKVVVLIDGVFHQSLSVWHKELVYALLEGVVCIGAASMGAIRAAELHRYSMIGVGKIFEMYRDGEEDDSLVAMTFDPTTFGPIVVAPIGQNQKTSDAIQAIEFARSLPKDYHVSTSLDKSAISPYLETVLKRITDG